MPLATHSVADALAYAPKKPALWPRVFGYHELFHLATLAANAAFFAFMLAYVMPVARR
jgi:predicted membrane channel-forming protein YqfA (hemolysin III family)